MMLNASTVMVTSATSPLFVAETETKHVSRHVFHLLVTNAKCISCCFMPITVILTLNLDEEESTSQLGWEILHEVCKYMKHSQLVCVYVHGCRALQIELGEILRIKSERLKYGRIIQTTWVFGYYLIDVCSI